MDSNTNRSSANGLYEPLPHFRSRYLLQHRLRRLLFSFYYFVVTVAVVIRSLESCIPQNKPCVTRTMHSPPVCVHLVSYIYLQLLLILRGRRIPRTRPSVRPIVTIVGRAIARGQITMRWTAGGGEWLCVKGRERERRHFDYRYCAKLKNRPARNIPDNNADENESDKIVLFIYTAVKINVRFTSGDGTTFSL